MITIVIIILVCIVSVYLGHAWGSGKELIKEQKQLEEIDSLLDTIDKLNGQISEAKSDMMYLQNRCRAQTHGLMCAFCDMNCMYREHIYEDNNEED